MTYRGLQRELKELKNKGYTIAASLNSNKTVLEREYRRLKDLRLTEYIIERKNELVEKEYKKTTSQLPNVSPLLRTEDNEDEAFKNTYVNQRAIYLFPLIEKLALVDKSKIRRDGNVNLIGWRSLALQETVNLKDYYPDDKDSNGNLKPIEKRRYHTAWNQNYKLKTELFDLIKSDYLQDKSLTNSMLNITTKLIAEIASRLMEYKTKSNHEYKKKVNERKKIENRISIDLTRILEKANSILTNLFSIKQIIHVISKKDLPSWEDVSCAIALATGRRMSEIHQSGTFIYIDDYHLSFIGQLKGKERTVNGSHLVDVNFTIPTLLKADLIITGIDYLQQLNKRISKDLPTVKVNESYSKPLSKAVRHKWQIYNQLVDPVTKIVIDKQTYHRFRAFYFIACSENYKLENDGDLIDSANYAAQIMGDRDITVLESYQRYKILPYSKTRI